LPQYQRVTGNGDFGTSFALSGCRFSGRHGPPEAGKWSTLQKLRLQGRRSYASQQEVQGQGMMIPRSQYQKFRGNEPLEGRSRETPSEGMVLEILLVDDDPNILSALSSSLADSNHHITTALGGQKALEALHRKSFDLVITDLNMPGVDGMAVLRKAKGIDSNTKVIIMTGSMIPHSTQRLISREANGFLPKPFGLTELYNTVTSCLGSEVRESSLCNETPCESPEALPP
jgi:two-component system alkaline phosphatase synthesis response regulator PhoP